MATSTRGARIEISKLLTNEARLIFAQWIGCYTVLWNCKVAENKKAYNEYVLAKAAGHDVSRPTLNQKYAQFITPERDFIKNMPSQLRRNAASKCHEAYHAGLKGVRAIPKFKNKYSKRNCLITNELFNVKLTNDTIEFFFKHSNKSLPFCHLIFPRKKEMLDVPNMVYISRLNDRYFLSYSYLKESSAVSTEKEILNRVKELPPQCQQKAVMGIDVGVNIPIAASTGQYYDFTPDEKKSIEKKDIRRIRYQKKHARQLRMAKKMGKAPGQNANKSKNKIADASAHMARVRVNMAHRISKAIADETVQIVVCEKIQIKNMTASVEPKQDPITLKYLSNGAKAKSSLNKAILNVGWGRILSFLEYKLREQNKLLIRANPYLSSQECYECSHTDKANRKSQEEFCCTKCGHKSNADHNAALVLKKRFINQLNTNTYVASTKAVKKVAIRKQKAARIAVLVCGAAVNPSMGSGCEAETSKRKPECHLGINEILEKSLEAHPL